MKLKEAIQSLCQSTNPLARSMDYIQEDLDNMGKELDFWMKDKIVQSQKLEEEERKTELELEALVSQMRVSHISCNFPRMPRHRNATAMKSQQSMRMALKTQTSGWMKSPSGFFTHKAGFKVRS